MNTSDFVVLDETTDAGEFIYHGIEQAVADRPASRTSALDTLTQKNVTSGQIGAILTSRECGRVCGAVEEMGMDVDTVEFGSARDRRVFMRGIENALSFMGDAARVARERGA